MEFWDLTIGLEDPIWIGIAFLCGLLVRQVGLPPMVGFLGAGFILNLAGAENTPFLSAAADAGITLMLFSIGLKLDLKTLVRGEILGVSVIHMTVSIVAFSLLGYAASFAGLLLFDGLDLTGAVTVGFILSFSSTVFAVKVLEEKGAMASPYGRVAIGVLVLQDIAAVLFLVISAGKVPSLWALGLLALYPARRILIAAMTKSGHGELLILFGVLAAFSGGALFEAVSLKAGLGALVFGLLLSGSDKSEELSRSLLSFKDLFLVCFFLTIGLAGIPNLEMLLQAGILVLLVPAKILLFLWLFLTFRMRAHGSVLASLTLGNYSEFGLIVAFIATEAGFLPVDWLISVAVAVAISFVGAAPVNQYADAIFTRFRVRLRKWQRDHHLPQDKPISLKGIRVLVFGLGRTGTPAFFALNETFEGAVLGIDMESEVVERFAASTARALVGDATSTEFWSRFHGMNEHVELILLSMPNKVSNVASAKRLRERGYNGVIAATAAYSDDVDELREAGIDDVFNLYSAAGEGLAQHLTAEFTQEAETEAEAEEDSTVPKHPGHGVIRPV